jgi:hypothetical protein
VNKTYIDLLKQLDGEDLTAVEWEEITKQVQDFKDESIGWTLFCAEDKLTDFNKIRGSKDHHDNLGRTLEKAISLKFQNRPIPTEFYSAMGKSIRASSSYKSSSKSVKKSGKSSKSSVKSAIKSKGLGSAQVTLNPIVLNKEDEDKIAIDGIFRVPREDEKSVSVGSPEEGSPIIAPSQQHLEQEAGMLLDFIKTHQDLGQKLLAAEAGEGDVEFDKVFKDEADNKDPEIQGFQKILKDNPDLRHMVAERFGAIIRAPVDPETQTLLLFNMLSTYLNENPDFIERFLPMRQPQELIGLVNVPPGFDDLVRAVQANNPNILEEMKKLLVPQGGQAPQ